MFIPLLMITNYSNRRQYQTSKNTLVNVYVDLVVFTRIAGTS